MGLLLIGVGFCVLFGLATRIVCTVGLALYAWALTVRDQQQVYVKAQSGATVAEEAPGVYKDVDEAVRVSDALGIGDKVARTFPVCTIKG